MDIKQYWNAVLKQDAEKIRLFFHDSAYINWHCTNEHFTVEEFIRANCEYPGQWGGEIQRVEKSGDLVITTTKVFEVDGACSFHVVSFIRILDGKIMGLDEYWGDDSPAPQWRLDKKIGTAIQQGE